MYMLLLSITTREFYIENQKTFGELILFNKNIL